MRGLNAVRNTNNGDDRKNTKQSCYDGLERMVRRGDSKTVAAEIRFKTKPYYCKYREAYYGTDAHI